MRHEDLTGKRFGKLVVTEDLPGQGVTNPTIKCRCDCGTVFRVLKKNVKYGDTTSCGCKRRLTVGEQLGYATITKITKTKVYFRCKCGTEYSRKQPVSRSRRTSCGCRHREARGRFVRINGESKTLTEWGEVIGVSRERARQLANKGKLEQRVLDTTKPTV